MEKKVINKSDWVASFNLIGRPVIGEYTFKIDEKSEKSNWIYNSLNLGVDCGANSGNVYAELMGGYSEDGKNVIYAHGKKEDGRDDFDKKIIVDFKDRFNDSVLEEIGDMSFFTVGLEKTSEGKTFYKKFLSSYDAIAYIKEHLREDMIINVRGNLKYSTYNDSVQVKKNITSIVLSKVEDTSKFKASFTQSILIDKDSFNLRNNDKDKGVVFVDTRVLDFVKEVNGVKLVNAKGEEKGGQYPFNKVFEFKLNLENEKQCKLIADKLFKVKKGITQINMEGKFIEGGAVVTATWDEVPDDIKDLVEMGIYSKEEVLAKCTANGGRERRMVLTKPAVKLVGENKVAVVQVFPEKYEEEDLVLDYLFSNKKEDDLEEYDFFDKDEDDDDDLDWLSKLG